MNQEAPSKDEEEKEEMVEIPPSQLVGVAEGIEALESIPQMARLLSMSGQSEEFNQAIQGMQETSISDDPEVMRAIRRINSEQKEVDDVSHEPQEIAEQVAELYDGDRLKAMRELLEEHNLRVVQQLLASDTGALSPKEVAFRNKGIISESTVRDHLRTLTEKGFVKKLEPDVESVPNEMPRTFYAASPFAIELLQEMGLWENLGMLYQIYNALDRSEDIQQIEEWDHRPTPDWI